MFKNIAEGILLAEQSFLVWQNGKKVKKLSNVLPAMFYSLVIRQNGELASYSVATFRGFIMVGLNLGLGIFSFFI